MTGFNPDPTHVNCAVGRQTIDVYEMYGLHSMSMNTPTLGEVLCYLAKEAANQDSEIVSWEADRQDRPYNVTVEWKVEEGLEAQIALAPEDNFGFNPSLDVVNCELAYQTFDIYEMFGLHSMSMFTPDASQVIAILRREGAKKGYYVGNWQADREDNPCYVTVQWTANDLAS